MLIKEDAKRKQWQMLVREKGNPKMRFKISSVLQSFYNKNNFDVNSSSNNSKTIVCFTVVITAAYIKWLVLKKFTEETLKRV